MSKNALPVPAGAISRPRARSCELTCSQSSSKIAQSSIAKYNFTSKKQLPVPAMAMSKPRALNCVHTSSHTSRLTAQHSSEK
jgi:hypothetical protein